MNVNMDMCNVIKLLNDIYILYNIKKNISEIQQTITINKHKKMKGILYALKNPTYSANNGKTPYTKNILTNNNLDNIVQNMKTLRDKIYKTYIFLINTNTDRENFDPYYDRPKNDIYILGLITCFLFSDQFFNIYAKLNDDNSKKNFVSTLLDCLNELSDTPQNDTRIYKEKIITPIVLESWELPKQIKDLKEKNFGLIVEKDENYPKFNEYYEKFTKESAEKMRHITKIIEFCNDALAIHELKNKCEYSVKFYITPKEKINIGNITKIIKLYKPIYHESYRQSAKIQILFNLAPGIYTYTGKDNKVEHIAIKEFVYRKPVKWTGGIFSAPNKTTFGGKRYRLTTKI